LDNLNIKVTENTAINSSEQYNELTDRHSNDNLQPQHKQKGFHNQRDKHHKGKFNNSKPHREKPVNDDSDTSETVIGSSPHPQPLEGAKKKKHHFKKRRGNNKK
jgi:hypothetical protein